MKQGLLAFLVPALLLSAESGSVFGVEGQMGIQVFVKDEKGASKTFLLYDRMIAVIIGVAYQNLPAKDQLEYAVSDVKHLEIFC